MPTKRSRDDIEVIGWRVKCETYYGDEKLDVQYLVGFDPHTAEPEWTNDRDIRNRDRPDTANSRVYGDRSDAFLARDRVIAMIDGVSFADKVFRTHIPSTHHCVITVVKIIEATSAGRRAD